MLYDNFSSGILGWGLAVFVYSFLANILQAVADGLGNFAAGIVDAAHVAGARAGAENTTR